MTILPKCPSCGLESAEIRCPRCNTLKLVGCDGACSACGSGCSAHPLKSPPDACPGDEAVDDAEPTGTPLAR